MMSPPRSSPSGIHDRRGISLAEVLIALAIFAVAFLFVLGIFPVSADSIRQARELNLAVHLAEQKVESSRAQAFDSVVSNGGSEWLTMVNNGAQQEMEFVYQVLVTDEPPVDPELKNIVISVSWTSESGLRTVHLETDLVEWKS
ncbi:MAG: prepilin-type N-terminal cleavage/methylation domain-containing protein [Armatimonadetes bacterium]|nr:prepilin-type N-terminal cleavage/methylation domain-containing protein [Armatimonadota bacterium]